MKKLLYLIIIIIIIALINNITKFSDKMIEKKNLNIKCDDSMSFVESFKTYEGRWCLKQKKLNKKNK